MISPQGNSSSGVFLQIQTPCELLSPSIKPVLHLKHLGFVNRCPNKAFQANVTIGTPDLSPYAAFALAIRSCAMRVTSKASSLSSGIMFGPSDGAVLGS